MNKAKTTLTNRSESNMTLPDGLLSAYCEFIKARFGISIRRNHHDLIKNIKKACLKFNMNDVEYLDALKHADENSELLSYFVSAITIGETYFFRDNQQIKVLTQYVLPQLIKNKIANQEKSIHIWSAGCSSGEEIYTIIMLLKDLLNDLQNWQLIVLATDINIESLKKGMIGEYSEWSMRSIPRHYLDKYFVKTESSYQLSKEIIDCVTFDYLNLNCDIYPSLLNGTTSQDLIICRNVLIYFDLEHSKNIMKKLSKFLANHGYLMLGASDPISLVGDELQATEASPSLFVKSTDPIPSRVIPPEVKVIHPVKTPLTSRQFPDKQVKPDENSDLELKKLVIENRWTDVIKVVDNLLATGQPSSYRLNSKALALANLGKIPEAITLCESSLKIDKINKETYFIYAMALSESNHKEKAEEAFKKALFIDPNYLMCRYQFGIFLLHMNKHKEAIKCLKNTINTAQQYPAEDYIPDSNSIKYKDLISILTNEISLHE